MLRMQTHQHGLPRARDPHPRAKVHREAFQEIRLAVVTVLLTHVSLFPLREPDVPAWAPLLYQLQLLDIRDNPDPTTLPVADRIRIGNQKRERGNFHFQREEYCLAARAYSMALSVLTTRGGGTASGETWLRFTDKNLCSVAWKCCRR